MNSSEVAEKERTLEDIFNSNGQGVYVSGVVEIDEYSTRIYTDAFEPDSHGHVPTVYLAPDEVKQLGIKQGDAVYLIFDAKFETAVVSRDPSGPKSESVMGSVASQFATMLQTIPRLNKFNPNGPGVFGFNACATCGTRVDINGLDMDNREHFKDGDCAGFARADLERIKAWSSREENEKVRRVLFVSEDSEHAHNAMLSTIQDEDVRKVYENVHKTLSSWLPRLREAVREIDQAREQIYSAELTK